MFRKKLMLMGLMVIMSTSTVAASTIDVAINNQKIRLVDAAPYLEDGRTMVPVRVVSENLGADVKWDNSSQTFEVQTHSTTILGKANNPTVTVNGVSKRLDPTSNNVVVTIKNDRTFVPLRFFSETLGYDVNYDAGLRTVFINSPNTEIDKPVVDKDVIYKPNMKPEDFIDKVPDRVDGMEVVKDQYGSQGQLGSHGGFLTLEKTNPYEPDDKGFAMKMVINGWNNPKYSEPPQIVERNAKTMKAVEEIFSMYTVESERVYKELNFAITDKGNHDGYTVKTSDGRTFQFTGESSGVVVRIK